MSELNLKFEIMVEKDIENELLKEENKKKKKKLILITIIILIIIFISILIFEIFSKKNQKIINQTNNNYKIEFINENIKKPTKTFNKYEIIKLNNYSIILINNPNTTEFGFIIYSKIGFHTGIIDGFAHFSEHIFFGGSKQNNENNLTELITKYNGYMNAYTDEQDTAFQFTGPNFNLEKSILILSDFIKNPEFNEDFIKNEIISVDSEFKIANNTEVVIDEILRENSNKKHPFSNTETGHCGNKKSLNKVNIKTIIYYLSNYFKILFNNENCFFSIYGSQSIEQLKSYALKYLNFSLGKPSVEILNDFNKKYNIIQNEKLFNEDNLGKIAFVNTNREKGIVYFFFEIPIDEKYKRTFDIITFLFYGNENNSLRKYLFLNNYAVNIELELENILFKTELISIKIYLTDKGVKNYNHIIESFFAYFNIIKKDLTEELIENIYKIHLINFLNKETTKPDLPRDAGRPIINYILIGGENILGYPIKDNYSLETVKKYLNYIQPKNAFIIFDFPQNIPINDDLEKKEEKILKFLHNFYKIYNIPEKIKNKLNKITQLDNFKFSIRKINNDFTNLKSLSKKPCYEISPIKCDYDEYNPNLKNQYLPYIIIKNDSIYSSMKIDRSYGLPIIKGFIKIYFKNFNENDDYGIIFQYFFFESFKYKFLNSFLNEAGTKIEIKEDYSSFCIFTFSTYSDLLNKITDFILDFIKKPINEEIYNLIKENYYYVNSENNDYPFSQVFQEVINIFKKFISPNISLMNNEYEYFSKETLKNYKYENYKNKFINYTNEISKIIYFTLGDVSYEQIIFNTNIFLNLINKTKEINLLQPIFNNFDIVELPQKISILYSTFSPNIYQRQSVILVLYELNNSYLYQYFRIYEICTGRNFFNYLRQKKGTGYQASMKIENILGKSYITFYAISPEYSPEQLDHLVNEAILDSFNIECKNYNDINNYFAKMYNNQFKYFDDKFNALMYHILYEENFNNVNLNQNEEINPNYDDVLKYVKNFIIENPKRIAILYHRGDISKDEINKQIKGLEKNYFLNPLIKNEIVTDINYLKKYIIKK